MIAFLKFLVLLCFINHANAKNNWLGEWIATDNWQSEFLIKINEDGSATSNYGSGETGNGNLQTEILKFFGIQVKLIIFLMELWVIKELEKTKIKVIHLG